MIGFFGKKMSNIPVDDGSSLNIPVTIKVIALIDITLMDTTVQLLLYLLLYCLIFNRTPAMMPLAAPLLGPYYLEGHISLKK
jgi:hypothetical protein